MSLSNEEKEKIKKKVIEVLKNTYDPEIPVNVYDLGLIYKIDVLDNGDIKIDMTMTTPTCPIAGIIVEMVEESLGETFGKEHKIDINLVWDPPWTPDKVTSEGRKKLKELYGYDIVEEWTKNLKEAEENE